MGRGIRMKQEQIVKYVGDINVARMKLIEKRNTDYSEQDIDNGLSNFHDVSSICQTLGINIVASEVAMVLGILKLVRDANKKRLGESPDSEVRSDNSVDFHNYMDLAALCELEERRQSANIESDSVEYPHFIEQTQDIGDNGEV